ncbi:hypothetical protein BCR34DRAFT_586126 [Clohesyomyces aquaticus]|uniref:Uncharacterized protein n=1 Tax=Clohesyomyces aquaticus TaxID=1231657 RepID=A0A1Y1ZUG5_9PLEO|nr:hypothetical protein BCR34DRAFT_586126 [Clohesyomyces aquaticus]
MKLPLSATFSILLHLSTASASKPVPAPRDTGSPDTGSDTLSSSPHKARCEYGKTYCGRELHEQGILLEQFLAGRYCSQMKNCPTIEIIGWDGKPVRDKNGEIYRPSCDKYVKCECKDGCQRSQWLCQHPDALRIDFVGNCEKGCAGGVCDG